MNVPRPGPRAILVLAGVLAALAGGWLWLRQSSLVAVNRVTIVGASGPDASQIRSALRAAADNMTTLDVRMSQLKVAVAPYPAVKDLRVSTQFPHGLRIDVIEQVPVGAVVVAGRTIPVAGDGTLLHDVSAPSPLPTIPLRVPPGGDADYGAQCAGRRAAAGGRALPDAREGQPGDDRGRAWARCPASQRPASTSAIRSGSAAKWLAAAVGARGPRVGWRALHRRHRPGPAGGGHRRDGVGGHRRDGAGGGRRDERRRLGDRLTERRRWLTLKLSLSV